MQVEEEEEVEGWLLLRVVRRCLDLLSEAVSLERAGLGFCGLILEGRCTVLTPISTEALDKRSCLSDADTIPQITMTRSSHARSTSLPATLPSSPDSAPSQPPAARLFPSSSSSPVGEIFSRHPFLPLRLRLPSRPVAAHMRPLSLLGTGEPGTVVARPASGGGDLAATTGETEFEVSKKARGDWVLEERRRWGYRMPKRPERVAVAV